jgi:hypothetical protein
MVGGAVWWSMAMMVMPASRPPAPPSRWPVMDLVELTSRVWLRARSPKTFSMALDSRASPSGVLVAWALT